MAVRKVYIDKSEIVLNIWEGGNHNYTLTDKQIQRISFETYSRPYFKVLSKKDDCIKFITTKYPPITLKRYDNKQFYDEYVTEIEQYAKDYKIKVERNVKVDSIYDE